MSITFFYSVGGGGHISNRIFEEVDFVRPNSRGGVGSWRLIVGLF
jgi:hypothetical protein